MGLVVSPIVKGQEEAWKKWTLSLKGEKKKEFDDFNKRYGLLRHDVWAVETPNGLLGVILHEGPGADKLMSEVVTSKHPFDLEMGKVLEVFHGMDMTKPPAGPMPVKLL